MTSSPPSTGFEGIAIFLVILVLILVRRTLGLVRGTRYSLPRLITFAGLYALLFGALGALTIYAAVGTWGPIGGTLSVPYAAVVLGAALLAAPYVQRIVRFERREGGAWYYRLPGIVPVLTLGLFLLRFVAEIAVFGIQAVSSPVLPSTLPENVLGVLVGIDLLFGVSVGLLLARAIGVSRAFRALPPAPEATTAPPLPSG